MPRATATPVPGYAHCPDPRCPGYSQQKVDAVREVVEHTYVDSGGDTPGVEKSMVYIQFANPDDRACGTCGRDREVTEQKRPTYGALSGYDQNGLLDIKPPEVTV